MKKIAIILFFAILLASCATLILVPPAIDLMPLEKIGLAVFTVENAEGPLDEMGTQLFLEEIQWAQGGVKIIELGTMDEILAKVDQKGVNPEAARAIGQEYGVSSFFHGKIAVSDVRPKIDIAAIVESLSVRATFDLDMSIRLISAEDGATLWTDSTAREGNLAHLHLSRRMVPFFTVRDQRDVYRELIRDMIRRLTRDFRSTRQRLR